MYYVNNIYVSSWLHLTLDSVQGLFYFDLTDISITLNASMQGIYNSDELPACSLYIMCHDNQLTIPSVSRTSDSISSVAPSKVKTALGFPAPLIFTINLGG